jgi:hypothetical protein
MPSERPTQALELPSGIVSFGSPAGGAGRYSLAANIAESPIDLILLAPEEEQAKLLAVTIGHVGHTFLKKSGAVEGGSVTTH